MPHQKTTLPAGRAAPTGARCYSRSRSKVRPHSAPLKEYVRKLFPGTIPARITERAIGVPLNADWMICSGNAETTMSLVWLVQPTPARIGWLHWQGPQSPGRRWDFCRSTNTAILRRPIRMRSGRFRFRSKVRCVCPRRWHLILLKTANAHD